MAARVDARAALLSLREYMCTALMINFLPILRNSI
jgi:hypothetical protein